jgi:arabinogalactan endo-1,4-beta-galactosidase
VNTTQALSGLAAGYYTVSGFLRSSAGPSGSSIGYLFAQSGLAAQARTAVPVRDQWTLVVVRGVQVTGGQLAVGLHSEGSGGQWVELDDVSVALGGGPYTFLQGGDVSAVSLVEAHSGVYRDEHGVAQDPFTLMADRGVNVVRLRLYNGTGPDHPRIGSPGDYLPAGFQDLPDNLALARRATAHGMKIQLTLHFSDYWSNGSLQDIPKDWRYVTGLPTAQAVTELTRLVHDYTRDVLTAMKAQGTPVDYVSLGNEMQGGLLFPYGRSSGSTASNLMAFLKAGYAGAKEASPGTQVVIHLDDAGNFSKYNSFFGRLTTNAVPYDVIGSSYYPYWTKKDIQTVLPFFRDTAKKFGKPILVMETGINWNPVTSYGKPGQLANNGPVPYPQTPQGQRNFLLELFAGLKSVDDGAVIGDLYWDPVMIPAAGVGWEVGGANVVENTTLFDFTGKALPAFDAYRYNLNAKSLLMKCQCQAPAS